jgi:outer membrane protein assembly factor BamB
VNDAGALVFRVKLPGGAPTAAAAFDDALLVAAGSGSLLGLDRADGRVLWKRRCKAQAIVRCGGRALVLEESALVCLDAQGEPVWEQELPAAAATPPIVVEGNALLLAGGAALSFSLADGRPRAPIALPWARHLAACDEDGAVIATGDGGAAARLDSKRWSVPADGPAPALPALVDRGVVLLHRSATALYDAAEGLPLAHLPSARAATLAADLSCALLHGDGEISMHRLTTHLSVL